MDALDDIDDPKARNIVSSRQTTSYRDLTDDRSLSPPRSLTATPTSTPVPTLSSQIPLSNLSLTETKIFDKNNEDKEEEEEEEEGEDDANSTGAFYNQNIPYPVVNDKRDLGVINRQLKNQLRKLEASKNNPLYDSQSNLINYERLKKQIEFINKRIEIEKLKRNKAKTQREKEQNRKRFHLLLQVCLTQKQK